MEVDVPPSDSELVEQGHSNDQGPSDETNDGPPNDAVGATATDAPFQSGRPRRSVRRSSIIPQEIVDIRKRVPKKKLPDVEWDEASCVPPANLVSALKKPKDCGDLDVAAARRISDKYKRQDRVKISRLLRVRLISKNSTLNPEETSPLAARTLPLLERHVVSQRSLKKTLMQIKSSEADEVDASPASMASSNESTLELLIEDHYTDDDETTKDADTDLKSDQKSENSPTPSKRVRRPSLHPVAMPTVSTTTDGDDESAESSPAVDVAPQDDVRQPVKRLRRRSGISLPTRQTTQKASPDTAPADTITTESNPTTAASPGKNDALQSDPAANLRRSSRRCVTDKSQSDAATAVAELLADDDDQQEEAAALAKKKKNGAQKKPPVAQSRKKRRRSGVVSLQIAGPKLPSFDGGDRDSVASTPSRTECVTTPSTLVASSTLSTEPPSTGDVTDPMPSVSDSVPASSCSSKVAASPTPLAPIFVQPNARATKNPALQKALVRRRRSHFVAASTPSTSSALSSEQCSTATRSDNDGGTVAETGRISTIRSGESATPTHTTTPHAAEVEILTIDDDSVDNKEELNDTRGVSSSASAMRHASTDWAPFVGCAVHVGRPDRLHFDTDPRKDAREFAKAPLRLERPHDGIPSSIDSLDVLLDTANPTPQQELEKPRRLERSVVNQLLNEMRPSMREIYKRARAVRHLIEKEGALWTDALMSTTSEDGEVPLLNETKSDALGQLRSHLVAWKRYLLKGGGAQEPETNSRRVKRRRRGDEAEDRADSDSDFDPDAERRLPQNPVILQGPTGCGKTAVVHALASQLGFDVISVSANEQRTPQLIRTKFEGAACSRRVATSTSSSSSLLNFFKSTNGSRTTTEGKRVEPAASPFSLILIDEADVWFSDESGGWGAVRALIASSRVPVILASERTISAARLTREPNPIEASLHHAVDRPPARSLADYLEAVVLSLKRVHLGSDSLLRLAHAVDCDVRAALNALHFHLARLPVGQHAEKVELDAMTWTGARGTSSRAAAAPPSHYEQIYDVVKESAPPTVVVDVHEEIAERVQELSELYHHYWYDSVTPLKIDGQPMSRVPFADGPMRPTRNDDLETVSEALGPENWRRTEDLLDVLVTLNAIDDHHSAVSSEQGVLSRRGRRPLHTFLEVRPDLGRMLDGTGGRLAPAIRRLRLKKPHLSDGGSLFDDTIATVSGDEE